MKATSNYKTRNAKRVARSANDKAISTVKRVFRKVVRGVAITVLIPLGALAVGFAYMAVMYSWNIVSAVWQGSGITGVAILVAAVFVLCKVTAVMMRAQEASEAAKEAAESK